MMFEMLIEAAKSEDNPQVAEMLAMHLALLRACKTEGIDAAFGRLNKASDDG